MTSKHSIIGVGGSGESLTPISFKNSLEYELNSLKVQLANQQTKDYLLSELENRTRILIQVLI